MYLKTKEHKENISKAKKGKKNPKGSKALKKMYANGYVNTMKGKKRPDLSEWNKKFKSKQMIGDKNPNKNPDVIRKRKNTIKGRTKELYGRSGPLNNNWKGGLSFEPYSYEFNEELKLAVRIRDGFKCKLCGKSEEELQHVLCVHHIDYNKKNNPLNNLVCLCFSCNSKVNRSRHNWFEYFSRSFNVQKVFLSFEDIDSLCKILYDNFLKGKNITGIVPIPRGGVVPAVIISKKYGIPLKLKIDNDLDVIIDEIVDFGVTFRKMKKKYPNNLFVCLHLNEKNFKNNLIPDFFVEKVNKYIVYPWECPDE